MSHDNEELCKIWRETDLLFQKWQKFGELWSEQNEIPKISTLLGFFSAKYIRYDLKKYRGVIFHDTEEWCKIWWKTDMWFGKWHDEYVRFSQEHLKISKLGLRQDRLIKSKKCKKWA